MGTIPRNRRVNITQFFWVFTLCNPYISLFPLLCPSGIATPVD
jgi:hypothetical protein